MQAFVEKALSGGGGAPTPGVQGASKGVQQARQGSAGENKSILSQVSGEVTRTEMIEMLIARLKDLIPKEKPQGGTANA